ncbi:porin family protein [Flavobacterium sp. UBA6135]|uniref:porin family protein n=1 Tax=Flavobacterium sp. UBA6135 TaxID=1946553 RepID=UPI0025B8C3B6|nr:porin family protein [Flavobacterium sp. UBA6135]
MKKIMLSILAVVAFGTANAQDIKFGVKAGANFSNFTGDVDSDGLTSFYIGGLVDFAVSEKFHVQPELLYSMEGAKDAEMSFVRIPIMAKYYVAEGFNLQAGPSIGFKVSADDGLDEVTKSMDFGLGFGAAYELPIGVFFDARYNLGLSDISDVNGFELKTTNFQVGLGYRF